MQTIFIVNILTEWTPGKISEKCRNCFFDRLENVLLTIKAIAELLHILTSFSIDFFEFWMEAIFVLSIMNHLEFPWNSWYYSPIVSSYRGKYFHILKTYCQHQHIMSAEISCSHELDYKLATYIKSLLLQHTVCLLTNKPFVHSWFDYKIIHFSTFFIRVISLM